MSTKIKFAIVSICLYIIFVLLAIIVGFLNPAKIGITWSVFWYIAAAGIAYYLWFKNVIWARVKYYARMLDLRQIDLQKMVPNLKKSQVVPDPQRKTMFAPIFNFSLQGLDILDKNLTELAERKHIKPFK